MISLQPLPGTPLFLDENGRITLPMSVQTKRCKWDIYDRLRQFLANDQAFAVLDLIEEEFEGLLVEDRILAPRRLAPIDNEG